LQRLQRTIGAIDCRLLTIYTPRVLNCNMPPDSKARLRPRAVPADHPIALVSTNALPTLVQRELTRQILAGDLPSGTRLTEIDTAKRLGVSRGPVREAFRALEESGLVRFEKNRGVYVRQVSLEEADEIYELRALLDEYAGRRAAQKARPADVEALEKLVDGMANAASAGEADEYFALNLAFHDRIVDLAGNAKLAQLYRRLVNELSLYRRASLETNGTLPVSVAEHRAIVARIAGRQPAAAGHLLHEHVLASRARAHAASPAGESGRRIRRAR
jgi:phosphonate utilization transcriptional regulator